MKNRAQPDTVTAGDMNQLIRLINAGRYADLEGKARELLSRHPNSGVVWQLGFSPDEAG